MIKMDKEQHNQNFKREIDKFQRRALEYDKILQEKLARSPFKSRKRTIAEEEEIIVKKFGGKKIDIDYFYKHLSDFFDFDDVEYLKSLSPSKIMFQLTEVIIPEEYFYSLYLIPLGEELEYDEPHKNQILVYVTSRDGANVYAASFLSNRAIRSIEFEKRLSAELCYCEDGVALYHDEILSREDIENEEKRRDIKKREDFQMWKAELYRFQRRMLKYDEIVLKNNKGNNHSEKYKRTIAEEEIIINKFGGKKLDIEDFYKNSANFFCDKSWLNDFEKLSPCKIVFNYTEEIIPDEYFHSFYIIPLDGEIKKDGYNQQLLAYVTSRDGIHVYIAGLLTVAMLSSRKIEKKLSSEICYCEEGIAIYRDEIFSQEEIENEQKKQGQENRKCLLEKLNDELNQMQRKILERDKNAPRRAVKRCSKKRKRTIAEEEDIIINKYGGKKLEMDYFYSHLSDFMHLSFDVFSNGMNPIQYLRLLSPAKMIMELTNEIVPEEYFYAFYLIPLIQDVNYSKPYDNQVIVYITSKDGVNVYTASFLRHHVVRSQEFEKKLSSAICYYEEGLTVYLKKNRQVLSPKCIFFGNPLITKIRL